MRAAVFLLALLATSPAAADERFEWLELLPGVVAQSEVTDLSADGCVAIGSVGTWTGAGGKRAVRWVAGSVEPIEDAGPHGPAPAPPTATSGDGGVVVGAGGFVNTNGISLLLPNPPGREWGSATALSTDGRFAVGEVFRLTSEHPTDVVRYAAGEFTPVVAPVAHAARAHGISADGKVIVGSLPVANGAPQAYRWQDGALLELGFLPGETRSVATALTPDGSIVVGTSGSRAFRWEAGAMTDLGPGTPADLSADGASVVGSGVWAAATGWRTLASALADWGLDVSALSLVQATAISDDGLAIVGRGIDPLGRSRAWLATREERDCSPAAPPEDPPPPPPLPATTSLDQSELPEPLLGVLQLGGLAIAPDGLLYLGGEFLYEDAPDVWRRAWAVLEITPGGAIRTLTEALYSNFEGSLAVDRETVAGRQEARVIRVDRRDGSVLTDVDLRRLFPAVRSVDFVTLDPDGNVYASTWESTSGCFGVAVVTPQGYVKRLDGPSGSPCFPEWVVPEWKLGALHLWTSSAILRAGADGALSPVVRLADGFQSLGYHDFDGEGNLYLADSDAQTVVKIAPDGAQTQLLDGTGDGMGHPLEYPVNLHVDARGHVFVGNTTWPWLGSWVFEILPDGTVGTLQDADGLLRAFSLQQIAPDRAGNLWALLDDSSMLLVGIPPGSAAPGPPPSDRDADGIDDAADNCPDYPNPGQYDADRDGHGSVCDADFDNDGFVGSADFARLMRGFGSNYYDPNFDRVVDMNGDGTIGTFEFQALRRSFGEPVGMPQE